MFLLKKESESASESALSSNDEKRIKSMDSMETDAHGTSKKVERKKKLNVRI